MLYPPHDTYIHQLFALCSGPIDVFAFASHIFLLSAFGYHITRLSPLLHHAFRTVIFGIDMGLYLACMYAYLPTHSSGSFM